ncbi:DJ-1 family glyoxalase III [Campylobacter vulpis]|uniref:4-methyl-5(B-hydroxyethyl)-thiazole monophosphate biosynthesis protein n=1 Tax=Campylobacter vulpis TaxID=1655500 RepID=A0A2G4R6N7_9BACT|nr:DJ-1 family glyoxalase III [Campylobacter vulpis]MBS4241628.1 DJ-1 family protein [Campylobacter vulpis]MBS4253142.1 DJ-1 family protein [Campylobacter vulpis]MBS4282363.1 DJ-1 family protein [Campylobacter vulpis]MBS4330395.1 DJ-1 family protein [Campylobacter vulpis]MBS4331989.1 DJ-1 family protein [Campylobacter vulpis]
MKKVLVPLAVGFEEAEFIGIADVLKRAGAMGGNLELIIASLDSELWVKGANGICIQADCSLESVDTKNLDAIALPGGFDGMNNLKNNGTILSIIKKLYNDKRIVAAICASPIVLNEAGVLSAEFACYPGCEVGLKGQRLEKAVLVRDNVITAAGPATAILFGLELAKALCGEEIYKALYEGMLVPLSRA